MYDSGYINKVKSIWDLYTKKQSFYERSLCLTGKFIFFFCYFVRQVYEFWQKDRLDLVKRHATVVCNNQLIATGGVVPVVQSNFVQLAHLQRNYIWPSPFDGKLIVIGWNSFQKNQLIVICRIKTIDFISFFISKTLLYWKW